MDVNKVSVIVSKICDSRWVRHIRYKGFNDC
jgi:hypothetical protein